MHSQTFVEQVNRKSKGEKVQMLKKNEYSEVSTIAISPCPEKDNVLHLQKTQY